MNKLRVLNLLACGGVGGIETLCLNAAEYLKNDNTYIFLWEAGIISNEMGKRGYKVRVLNTSIRRYLVDSFKIAKMCEEDKYDVVVCHHNNIMIALCIFWIRVLCKDIKIIGYMHCSSYDMSRRDYCSGKLFIWRMAQKIICISDNVLESVKERIGFADKLVRIYNGVDTNAFSPKKRASAADVLRIIYVGRLEKVKGIQNILKGLSELKEINYHFNIVGDGSYRNDLDQLTEKLNISGRVSFLGTRRDIPELLCQSDVFVHLPDWEEGFGITVIEAMAAGKIVIVNDHGALPEIVTDGVNGFVVREGGRTFKKTLTEIYNGLYREELACKLEKIRENAVIRSTDFSIQKYAEEIDHLIESVVR